MKESTSTLFQPAARRLMIASLLLTLPIASLANSPAAGEQRFTFEEIVQDIHYAKAAQRGGQVIVIPGDIEGAHSFFTETVTAKWLAQIAEHEFERANFALIEHGGLGEHLTDLRLAYLSGKAELAKPVLSIGKLKNTRWAIRFDVLEARPVAGEKPPVDPKLLFGLATVLTGGLAAGAMMAPNNALDKLIPQDWLLRLRYSVFDAHTAQPLLSEILEEKIKTPPLNNESFKLTAQRVLSASMQRVTQKAVSQLDLALKTMPQGNTVVTAVEDFATRSADPETKPKSEAKPARRKAAAAPSSSP